MAGTRTLVDVEGRRLGLANLDKILYPASGTTKAEVIDYYTRIAPVLLPHLAGRPLTRKRWPDGVTAESFFEKNAPRGTPEWVRTVTLPSPGSSRGSEDVTYIVCDDLPTVVWLANLAVLEFHVPQWRVDGDEPKNPDRLVLDFDPGAPATIVDCCRVALLVAEALAADGMLAFPKTSGSKGMQAYVPVTGEEPAEVVHGYARRLAERLEKQHPSLVVSRMDKRIRRGKVLIDWSQNSASKTTVAPYSLRGGEPPLVSAPVTWDEVEVTAREGGPLAFTPDEVLARVGSDGDLLADLHTQAYEIGRAHV